MFVKNFLTLEEARGLNSKGLHCARARDSKGTLRSKTPGLISASIGPRLFIDSGYCDIIPYPYPKDGSPLDIVTLETFKFIMKHWGIVLRQALDDQRIAIALCSKATANRFAKYVLGGDINELHKIYDDDSSKLISAAPDKFVPNYHSESIYNLLYWIKMLDKCETSDAFYTNAIQAMTGDTKAKCTFAMSLFEEGSDAFKFVMAAFLQKCSFGGTNCSIKKKEAVITYYTLLQDGFIPSDALKYLEEEEGDEAHNLVVNYLHFDAASKFSAQLGSDYDGDVDSIKLILLKDMMATAELINMPVLDFLDNIKLFRDGRDTIKKKGRVSWQKRFEELEAFKVEHGHCNVPKNTANLQLGKWVGKQRYEYKLRKEDKKSQITDDRVTKLESLGFEWSLNVPWEERFEDLKAFKVEHGHCNVPQKFTANPQLGSGWAPNVISTSYSKRARRVKSLMNE